MWYVHAGQPIWVASPIVALVVMPNDWHNVRKELHITDELTAQHGVAPDEADLLSGELHRGAECVQLDADLSHIVEQGRALEQLQLPAR